MIKAIEFDIQSCCKKYEPYTVVQKLANIKSSHAKDTTREILTLDQFSIVEWEKKTFFIIQDY